MQEIRKKARSIATLVLDKNNIPLLIPIFLVKFQLHSPGYPESIAFFALCILSGFIFYLKRYDENVKQRLDNIDTLIAETKKEIDASHKDYMKKVEDRMNNVSQHLNIVKQYMETKSPLTGLGNLNNGKKRVF